jgi:hypothetical protein
MPGRLIIIVVARTGCVYKINAPGMGVAPLFMERNPDIMLILSMLWQCYIDLV